MSDATQRQLERGSQWLEKLLTLAGFPAEVEADLSEPLAHSPASEEDHDEVVWLTIGSGALSAEQVQILTGKGGAVLDAIQYMASLELNFQVEKEGQLPFVIDIDGYRETRLEELVAIATTAANQVQTTGQEYELQGLSSAERRQVHTIFKANFPDLETFSRGKEPERYLVVHPR